jgi:hypothetical protein
MPIVDATVLPFRDTFCFRPGRFALAAPRIDCHQMASLNRHFVLES